MTRSVVHLTALAGFVLHFWLAIKYAINGMSQLLDPQPNPGSLTVIIRD